MIIQLKSSTRFVRHIGLTTTLLLVCLFHTGQAQSSAGSITNSYSRATVNGESMVGGLVGSISGGVSVQMTYSAGMVRGGHEGTGGMIGSQTGQADVSSSYWDMQSSGLEQSAAGEGRNTAQMIDGQPQSTFQGWDFTQVWQLDGESRNSGYPYLKESPPVTYSLQLQTNLPEAGTVSGAGQYGQGTTVTLRATASEGFVFVNWRDSGNQEVSSNETFDFAMPAEHLSLTAHFSGSTNISERAGLLAAVYPNPFKDKLQIEPGNLFHTVSVYNTFGQQVVKAALEGSLLVIDTSALPPGLYLIHLQGSGGNSATKKMVKQ